MTTDEAIKKIQYGLELETTEMTPFGQLTAVDTEALKMTLDILRAQQAEKNDPLTLEELREIVGQLERCGYECEGGPLENSTAFIRLKELAYRHKPKEADQ